MMQKTKPVKNPGKQRKMFYNAPAHKRHKYMSAHVSRTLSAAKGAKSLPVRKGDTVLIKRGDNAGFEGKVSRIDLKAYRIYIEGLTREKVDGTNIFLPIHPSKVEIRNLNLDDKWRKDILNRKQAVEKPAKPKKEEKPKAKSTKIEDTAKDEEDFETLFKEEKTTEAKVPAVVEEAVPEVAAEPAPAEEVAPEPKKATAKKPAAKKAAIKKEASLKEENAPTTKKIVTKPKTVAKKATAKKTEDNEAAPKAKAKKASAKGGQ